MAETRPSFFRRNRWLMWIAGAALVVLVALVVAAAVVLRRVEPFLRAQIVTTLSQHFHARVELDSFHVSLVDGSRPKAKGCASGSRCNWPAPQRRRPATWIP